MQTNRQIAIYDLPLAQLPDFLSDHFINVHGLGGKYVKDMLQNNLEPELRHLRKELHMIVELPYVDKMYRDTYYHYYASRLKSYQRDSIRVSLFDRPIAASFSGTEESIKEISTAYLGFFIIRPTLPKLIGRSAINPRALQHNRFICCKASIPATALGVKVTALAFPHASQDGQALSCAETTIWSILEYFGNKYPEYQPILPSQIIRLLQKFTFKRQLPSDGLTAEQIAYVVREVGFGVMIYSESKHNEQFPIALSMFIESGIPVIGVLKSKLIAHAVNIIGRHSEDRSKLFATSKPMEEYNDVVIHDFHAMPQDYVFIDDNLPPYQLAPFNNPCKNYSKTDWKDCKLTNIIVPLYPKIYLDAIRARKNFLVMLQDKLMSLSPGEPIVSRTFLASSRSYKAYLAQSSTMDSDVREIMLLLAMPKFIWVSEVSTQEAFENQRIVGFMLQDATDPVEYAPDNSSKDISIFFGLFKDHYFTILNGKVLEGTCENQSFPEYSGNLG